MKDIREYWVNRGLGMRDMAILEAIMRNGGKVTWTSLLNHSGLPKMSKRTLAKHLKSLTWLGFLAKKEERVNGRLVTFYVLQNPGYLKAMERLERKLTRKAGSLYVVIRKPGLSMEARQVRLIAGIFDLLDYQNAWILLTVKEGLSITSEEKAARFFLKMMDAITPYAAGSAFWLCWENKPLAAQVLEQLLSKGKAKGEAKNV